jgi:hypothetical protein
LILHEAYWTRSIPASNNRLKTRDRIFYWEVLTIT